MPQIIIPEKNTNKREAQKILTRQKLIESTADIIAVEGISGATFTKVAQKADLSHGIVHFHFKTKENLLLSVYLYLFEAFSKRLSSIIDSQDDPVDQIKSLINAIFDPTNMDERALSCSYSFYIEARKSKSIEKYINKIDTFLYDIILVICKNLVHKSGNSDLKKTKEIAKGLFIIIVGCNDLIYFKATEIKLIDMKRVCFNYLCAFFPQYFKI